MTLAIVSHTHPHTHTHTHTDLQCDSYDVRGSQPLHGGAEALHEILKNGIFYFLFFLYQYFLKKCKN